MGDFVLQRPYHRCTLTHTGRKGGQIHSCHGGGGRGAVAGPERSLAHANRSEVAVYRLSMPQDRLASCSQARGVPGPRVLMSDSRGLRGWTNSLVPRCDGGRGADAEPDRSLARANRSELAVHRLSTPQDRLASCSQACGVPGLRVLMSDSRGLQGWTNSLVPQWRCERLQSLVQKRSLTRAC